MEIGNGGGGIGSVCGYCFWVCKRGWWNKKGGTSEKSERDSVVALGSTRPNKMEEGGIWLHITQN